SGTEDVSRPSEGIAEHVQALTVRLKPVRPALSRGGVRGRSCGKDIVRREVEDRGEKAQELVGLLFRRRSLGEEGGQVAEHGGRQPVVAAVVQSRQPTELFTN